MKDLHVRQEAIKILEEKAGKNLFDLGRSNFLLNKPLEARETKTKMNYWDLIKIKSFFTAKETISKTKRQLMELKKIKLNTPKPNNSEKKWAKDMNRHFSNEDNHMATET